MQPIKESFGFDLKTRSHVASPPGVEWLTMPVSHQVQDLARALSGTLINGMEIERKRTEKGRDGTGRGSVEKPWKESNYFRER